MSFWVVVNDRGARWNFDEHALIRKRPFDVAVLASKCGLGVWPAQVMSRQLQSNLLSALNRALFACDQQNRLVIDWA